MSQINAKHKIVALLPMKANSERVKGKNFKDFCGKPLFLWVLDNLLALPKIEKIVINTDARGLLADQGLVDNQKIIIRDRPKSICGDDVSMNLIIEDDLNSIDSDNYLMTHTTNPLLKKESINQALNMFEEEKKNGFDSLFTVTKTQTRFYDENSRPINHDPDNLIRTQDLTPWFEENSNLYIFSRESFFKKNNRIGVNPKMFITEQFESTDIDTPADWDLAEILVSYYRNKGVI